MRGLAGLCTVIAAGCYRPDASLGVPCASNGACPSGQICDPNASPPRCVDVLTGIDAAPVPDDAPLAPDAPVDVDALPWQSPTRVILTLPAGAVDDPTLTDDRLELYFNFQNDIFVATRASVTAPWGTPVRVAELSSTANETTPEIAGDGLTIYFASDRVGTLGGADIWIATRPARGQPWSTPTDVMPLNSAGSDVNPTLSSDGLAILLASTRGGGADDVFISTRASVTAAWTAPSPLAELDDPVAADQGAMLASDGLSVVFASTRRDAGDLFVARRASPQGRFDPPEPIAELDTAVSDSDPWMSSDKRHLVFSSTRDGTQALYESAR